MNFREYRKRAGLTQETVANAIGLERSYYARMERGERFMSAPVFCKLVLLFGLSTHERELIIRRTSTLPAMKEAA